MDKQKRMNFDEGHSYDTDSSVSGNYTDAPKIIVDRALNEDIWRYANSDPKQELGGVLLGTLEDNNGRTTILITEAIDIPQALSSDSDKTISKDVWEDILQLKKDDYPDLEILGWFHTHPGLGSFLSEWDKKTHKSYFKEPWQILITIDPVTKRSGFYRWESGILTKVLDDDDDRRRPQAPKRTPRTRKVEESSSDMSTAFDNDYNQAAVMTETPIHKDSFMRSVEIWAYRVALVLLVFVAGYAWFFKTPASVQEKTVPVEETSANAQPVKIEPSKTPPPSATKPAEQPAAQKPAETPKPTPPAATQPPATNKPATSTPTPANPAVKTRDYTIKAGDSLDKIARKELGDSTKVKLIKELNPGLDPQKLQVGDIIKLPADPRRQR